MEYTKPVNIESINFEEESLPSGRKLVHIIFKQKFGTYRYKWTPPWKGEYGVEKIFLKALEIEEFNDPEGIWSKELKEAAKEVPSLDEIRLPLKITLGEITEEIYKESGDKQYHNLYRIYVEILEDKDTGVGISLNEEVHKIFIKIGNVKIAWNSLKDSLQSIKEIKLVSTEPEEMGEYIYSEWCPNGIHFCVWIPMELNKSQFQNVGREISFNIRSIIRKYLSHYKALNRGFEETK